MPSHVLPPVSSSFMEPLGLLLSSNASSPHLALQCYIQITLARLSCGSHFPKRALPNVQFGVGDCRCFVMGIRVILTRFGPGNLQQERILGRNKSGLAQDLFSLPQPADSTLRCCCCHSRCAAIDVVPLYFPRVKWKSESTAVTRVFGCFFPGTFAVILVPACLVGNMLGSTPMSSTCRSEH